MSLQKLIRHFSAIETLPIDVNDVATQVKALGIQDEIRFIPVEMNTDVIRGNIHRYTLPALAYKEPCRCADIYYDGQQSDDWKRLVCCKELVHLFDPAGSTVKNKDDLRRQVEKIVLPSEFQDPVDDGLKVITDRLATYYAAAILLPLAARALLLPAIDDGKLTVEDVGRIADIPTRYAALVLSAGWAKLHPLMV